MCINIKYNVNDLGLIYENQFNSRQIIFEVGTFMHSICYRQTTTLKIYHCIIR